MTAKRGIVPRGATPLDRALRRVRDRSRLIERVAAWPPIGRFAATILVSAHVRERLRFIVREVLGSRARARYRLRASSGRVWLRHRTPDVQNFDEIFYQGLYLPPAPAAAALAGRSATRVADLGANIGLAGAYFLGKLERAEVVAFEPDPANAEIHQLTLDANGLGDRWQLIRACASIEDGDLPFVPGAFAESHIVYGDEEATLLPALDVFPYLEQADLIKIDIEGAEWPILLDERFAELPARAVVLEYHAHLCPEADPRRLAEQALSNAGYDLEPIFHEDDGTGMLWAWRAAP